MIELNTFNEVFSLAKAKGLVLNSFNQMSDSRFRVNWKWVSKAGTPRFPDPVEHERPFDALRDALLVALQSKPAQEPAENVDLFS